MPKKPKISQEDIITFLKAIEGSKPFIQKKVKLTRPRDASTPIPQNPENESSLSDSDYLNPVKGEEFLEFKRIGVSYKTLRKLRKAQYNVEATLDLHRMRVDEAKIAVDHFVQQCVNAGIRVALVIHGKGYHSHMPILKNKLNHWLREIDNVVAFCSATSSHGSRGALYILLKKSFRGDLA